MSSFGEMGFNEFLDAVAAKAPTPGGGAVASAVGALGSALAQMVVNYSIGKKNLSQHEGHLRAAIMRLERARELLLALANEDAEAYGAVNALSRLPETDPRRIEELPEALSASVNVPLSTIAACVDVLRLLEDLSGMTNRHLRSDLAIAAILADAAARSSRWNVIVNAAALNDEGKRIHAARQMSELLHESSRLRERVERLCEA